MSDLFPCGLMVSDVISRGVSYANGYLYKLIGRESGTEAVDLLEQVFTKASLIFIDSYLYPMLLAEGKCDERLLTVRHVNGSRIPVVVNLELKDENCAAWSIMPAVERNTLYQELLTAREALEQHADHLQEDLKRLTSEADIGYADVSPSAGWVRCNLSFSRHHNWSDDTREIRLDEMYSSYTQEHARVLPGVIEKVVDSGVEQRFTLQVDTNTGVSRFLEMRVYLTRTDTDAPILRLVTIDVTQRTVMQREIEDAEREAQESLASLLRTQKKQSQIYGMIAHELRTPVATVAMLANDTESDFGLHQGSIRQACKDLLSTIDDMSLLIDPEKRRPVRAENFSVVEFNQSVADNVASILASTDTSFERGTDISEPALHHLYYADTYRIRIALTNLIKNACLHAEGTRLSMTTSIVLSEDRTWLSWRVSDDGVGLSEREVAALFTPYRRGNSKAEGTGLGLHIARTCIEEIGGSVRHVPGVEGATFEVLVPAEFSPPNTPMEHTLVIPRHDEDLFSNLRVLIVEDDFILRKMMEKLVGKLVESVVCAENGLKGLEAYKPEFDLILTDYFMPEMHGAEMIRRIRKMGCDVPIIGVTAATIGDQKQEMIDAGADSVIPKPLTPDLFKQVVREIIEARFTAHEG